MPSTGPSGFGRNEYYGSHEEYLHEVAEAMREEYLGIVGAGFILQVDDPFLIDMLSDPTMEEKERQRLSHVHVEALNHALRGIPADQIRHHTCYGLNHGPRMNDIPLIAAVPFMLAINAGAHSFEVANPRHYHEWRIWEDVKLPDGKILIPGLIGHATNYVEHPELIADYIVKYAGLVGRENVIAGADCGFSSRASSAPEVHRTVAVPSQGSWLRRLFAFAGPAYLVSVGYMDPGNWATDLAGGSKFGYQLIWVLLMSNLMAVFLQALCARLGVVTGKDLAQACRDFYPSFLTVPLWILCTGLSFLVAAVGAYFRDLQQVVPLLTTAVLFLSPVFYPEDALPEALRPIVLALSPIGVVLPASKDLLFYGEIPPALPLVAYTAYACTVLALGWWVYGKASRGFADVV